MPVADAVLGRDSHHAPRGQVLAVRRELLGRAHAPAAAEEKDDGRHRNGAIPVRPVEQVQLQRGIADPMIDVRLAFYLWHVARSFQFHAWMGAAGIWQSPQSVLRFS